MSPAKPATDPDRGIFTASMAQPCSNFTTSSSKPLPFRFDGCATSISLTEAAGLVSGSGCNTNPQTQSGAPAKMEVIKRFGDKVFARDVSASVAGADRRRHDRLGCRLNRSTRHRH